MRGLKIDIDSFLQGGFEMGPIQIAVPEGCVMGIIGENGAGKTSLMNLITRRVHTGDDWIQFNGSYEYREEMGFIIDEIPFGKSYKVKDVETLMRLSYKKWNRDTFNDYCSRYELKPSDSVKSLSLGMGQRLMQATALSHKAKLLVFDEPNDGIDPFIRTQLLNDLRNTIYEDNTTVVISSHNVSELEEIVDYVTYMEKGKVLFSLDIEQYRDQALELLAKHEVSEEGVRRYLQEPSLSVFTTVMQTERF